MENCKADNTAEKRFRSYWKQVKISLCKKHLCQGLSINICYADVSAIKNILLKHQQIYSKNAAVGGCRSSAQNFNVVSFSIRNTYFQEHQRVFLFFFFFFFFFCFFRLSCVKQEFTLFVSIDFFKKSDALYFFVQADYF